MTDHQTTAFEGRREGTPARRRTRRGARTVNAWAIAASVLGATTLGGCASQRADHEGSTHRDGIMSQPAPVNDGPVIEGPGSSSSGLVPNEEIPEVVVDSSRSGESTDQSADELAPEQRSSQARADIAGVAVELVEALDEALDDERKAIRMYKIVIDEFGSVRPFVNIINAEVRHAEALIGLYNFYGIAVPADPWLEAEMEIGESRRDACEIARQWEIENAAMYQRLLELPAVANDERVRLVFQHLQYASQEHHLPAFERCAASGGGPGTIRGNRGQGQGQDGRRRGGPRQSLPPDPPAGSPVR